MGNLKQLSDFFSAIAKDGRIGVTHIAVYSALLTYRVNNGCRNPIHVYSRDIMPLAKISASTTYHRCMKQLSEYGYIRYQPSFKCNQASRIFFKEIP